MTGWLLYSKEDVEKNKFYIQMYVEKFARYNIDIRMVVIQNIKNQMEEEKPDFAINRSRSEYISRQLEMQGIRVFNSSKVTGIANDKAKTYDFLKGDVPFMPVKCEGKEIISKIAGNQFAFPYVIKSCDGHGGNQVFMVSDDKSLSDAVDKMDGHKYLIQQSCSDLGKDVRVYIIGNKIIAAMLRTSAESFKSNYSLGGKAERYELNEEEKRMVMTITEKLPMDFAGIDFIFHKGRAVFNEIEDAVGARMLYDVAAIDIVQLFVDYIVEELSNFQESCQIQ